MSIENDQSGTLILNCTEGGIPIGGGAGVGLSLVGVMTDDLPLPDSGTPTDWKITVVNTSGQRITEAFSIECATGPDPQRRHRQEDLRPRGQRPEVLALTVAAGRGTRYPRPARATRRLDDEKHRRRSS